MCKSVRLYVLLSGCELWVALLKSYKCVLSLTEWCESYVVVWLRSSESASNEWMLNVCQSWFIDRHVLVVPKSKMKTGCSLCHVRLSGQHLLALFQIVHLVYGLTWRLEVTVCSCVFAVLLPISLYTELRETWNCVFMFGICCVIAVSLFLYYTGWWLYIGSLWIMQGKSVACTLLQLFNKVSDYCTGSYSTSLCCTSSFWAVERRIVVCVLEPTYVYSVFITKNQKKTNTEQVHSTKSYICYLITYESNLNQDFRLYVMHCSRESNMNFN